MEHHRRPFLFVFSLSASNSTLFAERLPYKFSGWDYRRTSEEILPSHQILFTDSYSGYAVRKYGIPGRYNEQTAKSYCLRSGFPKVPW